MLWSVVRDADAYSAWDWPNEKVKDMCGCKDVSVALPSRLSEQSPPVICTERGRSCCSMAPRLIESHRSIVYSQKFSCGIHNGCPQLHDPLHLGVGVPIRRLAPSSPV